MNYYGIYSVRYDEKHSHIDEVKAYRIEEGTQGEEYIFSRDEIIEMLESKYKIYTYIKRETGYEKGSEIGVHVIDKKKYMKTNARRCKNCNLMNLPEY